jgi:hypothetical protein
MSIKIHGKDYVLVNERVQEFHKLYPSGSIRTDLIEFSDERFIVKAEVCPDVNDRMRIFTGYAYEMVGSSQINKTSALENAETSAVGRALGILGIGIDGSIASADEVQNAVHQQEAHKVTEQQKDKYQELLKHKCFDGKRKKTNDWWLHVYDESNSNDAANKALKVMNQAIKLFENPETIKQEEK